MSEARNENKIKLVGALTKARVEKEQLDKITASDFTKRVVISIWEPPLKVDFFTYISLVSFQEASDKKVIADVEGLKIPFIHLNHLVLAKINTGRPQDKADVEQLQKIQALKKKK